MQISRKSPSLTARSIARTTVATVVLGVLLVIVALIVTGDPGSAGQGPSSSSLSSSRLQTKQSSSKYNMQKHIGNNVKRMNDTGKVSSLPAVRFRLVPTEEGVMRYAAYIGEDKDGTTTTPLSMAEWIRLMTHHDRTYSESLSRTLTTILQNAPYGAFRFETPGVSAESVEQSPFEFVLVKDSYLESFASNSDPSPFGDYLSSSACQANGNIVEGGDSSVAGEGKDGPTAVAACVFMNLGGDARLVVPVDWSTTPASMEQNRYGHLAAFVRGAPDEQIVQVWRTVAETLKDELLDGHRPSQKPLWLSTAGTGVAWLHFRLDSRPKYYLYRPFQEYRSSND